MPDLPAVPTLDARINQLFALVPRVARTPEGTARAGRFTSDDAAAVLQHDLGLSHARARRLIDELRASTREGKLHGNESLDKILASLARMFGTTSDYFDSDADLVSAAEDALIRQAMAALDIRAVAVCRTPMTRGAPVRAQLKATIDAVLNDTEESAGDDGTDFANPHHVRPTRWQDHAHGEPRRRRAAAGPSDGSAEGGEFVVSLTVAEIRALCVQLLHDLDLAPPLDPQELCRRLAYHRGRPIKLIPIEVNAPSSVGHLTCRRRYDAITYRADAPAPLQAHVTYHEVVHLLLDHLDGLDELICGMFIGDAGTGPSLYSDVQEWEAETGATILSELAARPENPQWVSRDATTTDLVATFGLTGGRW